MVLHAVALSYLHFVFAFLLIGSLAAEAFVLRLPVDARVAKLVSRIDMFYGASAVGVLAAGFSRAIWGASGWSYYAAQPYFWIKIAVFVLVGLLSISPTLRFFRWAQAARADASFQAPEPEVKAARRMVMIEVHLLASIPLFAALMARGVGS